MIPLLYCWRCPLAQGTLSYRVNPSGKTEWVSYIEGPPEEAFPYSGYPDHFPGAAVELVALSEREQQTIRSLNLKEIDSWAEPKLSVPLHQVGGEPYYVQAAPVGWLCPECNDPFRFLAAIGDGALSAKGFTGNPYVQVLYHLCPACLVVSAYQQCD